MTNDTVGQWTKGDNGKGEDQRWSLWEMTQSGEEVCLGDFYTEAVVDLIIDKHNRQLDTVGQGEWTCARVHRTCWRIHDERGSWRADFCNEADARGYLSQQQVLARAEAQVAELRAVISRAANHCDGALTGSFPFPSQIAAIRSDLVAALAPTVERAE